MGKRGRDDEAERERRRKEDLAERRNLAELSDAFEAAGIPFFGRDFLLRALAILYCYGGGPGSEHFRAPLGHAVAMKAGQMLEQAVMEKDWETVGQLRLYVRELREDRADWLNKTLDRLNIPAREIKYQECIRTKL